MSIDYIMLSTDLLQDRTLADKEKLLLALVTSCNERGLRLSNVELGKLLCVHEDSVGRLLKNLEAKKRVRIDKPQSRWRVIYSDTGAGVEMPYSDNDDGVNVSSTPTLAQPTPTSAQVYSDIATSDTTKETKERRARKAQQPGGDGQSFERFWLAYPKKVDRQSALKTWGKLHPDNELQKTILAALERHKETEQWTKDNGRFVPHPSTWLNGRRWEDHVEVEIDAMSHLTHPATEEELARLGL